MIQICLILISFLFSINSFSQLVPNDSCAMSLKNERQLTRCDDGVYEWVHSKWVIAENGVWDEQIERMLFKDPSSHVYNKKVKYPNDSCAISFKYGQDFLVVCDEAIYKIDQHKKISSISQIEWNAFLYKSMFNDELKLIHKNVSIQDATRVIKPKISIPQDKAIKNEIKRD